MRKVNIILSSSSQNRKELLARLKVPFVTAAPNVDESILANETPVELGRRLAKAKAEKTASNLSKLKIKYPLAKKVIIGSDQVAFQKNQIFNKPETKEKAISQLQIMQGKSINFWTAIHLLLIENENIIAQQFGGVMTNVVFRKLKIEQIKKYVELDNPLTCAGSARCESLGIALLSSINSSDPTAIMGLPLVMLTQFMNNWGYDFI